MTAPSRRPARTAHRGGAHGLPRSWPRTVASTRGRRVRVSVLRVRGAIASDGDDREQVEAETHFTDALALARMLDLRPLVAHGHLGLGKLYRPTGQQEEAHDHITTATTMYREMGMTYWLEKAEAEMKGLS